MKTKKLPEQELQDAIKNSMATYQKRILSERIKRGLTSKKK